MDATGLPDGTVYPILRRLERRGVLEGRWEDEEAAKGEEVIALLSYSSARPTPSPTRRCRRHGLGTCGRDIDYGAWPAPVIDASPADSAVVGSSA